MPNPTQRYQEALRLFRHNQLIEAVSLLESVLAEEPDHADALEALGVMYGKLERFDGAIKLMNQLAKLNPDSVMAHTNLSQFYMRKGMIQEAEREQAEARRLSWKAELRAKKMSEAEISQLANQEAQADAQAIERKITQFKKAIEYDPKDVLGYFTLGSAYLQGKRYMEAMQTFQKGIEVGPDHSPSYVGLGEALEALGQKAEAVQLYKTGIPVAEKRGDIIPLRKMENRLRALAKTDS